MYTINKVVLATAAFALLATAIPAEPRDLYVREATASVACGNGQVISCCDKSTSNTDSGDTDGGLLGVGNVANGLLGGACTPLGVGVLGAGVPINKACGNNVAACCTGDQSGGLANLQCTTLNVL